MKNTVVGPAYDLLSSREDGIIEELRELASATTWGDYNLAHAGLNDFVAVLKLVPRTAKARRETKRPESDLQYVLWKAIESRAGGCIDLKMSGLDQTNKAGLVSQENASKVFDALMGIYQTDHHIHQWLVLQIRKWEPLANALYDVGCFMKSQRKRSPAICDKKLFRLWCAWEVGFPGMKFNKFHGLFCTVRHFVHEYHMAGRVSEESNEAYNGTLKHVKGPLRAMPVKGKRIETITNRAQRNIKGPVLDAKLKTQSSIKGKRRGPQKKKAMVTEDRYVVGNGGGVHEIDGERYVLLPTGNLLPECWMDIYEWFEGGKAPKEWVIRMGYSAPDGFTVFDRLKEEQSSLV